MSSHEGFKHEPYAYALSRIVLGFLLLAPRGARRRGIRTANANGEVEPTRVTKRTVAGRHRRFDDLEKFGLSLHIFAHVGRVGGAPAVSLQSSGRVITEAFD